MSINLVIPGSFVKNSREKRSVEVNGKTIGQCLVDLIQQYPDIKKELFYAGREEALAEEGQLWTKIEILLNDERILKNILTTSIENNDRLEIKINTR